VVKTDSGLMPLGDILMGCAGNSCWEPRETTALTRLGH
jgi:hypothetical protein